MSLTPLEQHVFAYYVKNGADQLSMVGRFWPYGELTMLIQDKIQVATRKFGSKAGRTCPTVARAFLDLLIEREAFSTKTNEYGGTMHQFQGPAYTAAIKDLQATDPIIQAADAAGPDFWAETFAALTA